MAPRPGVGVDEGETVGLAKRPPPERLVHPVGEAVPLRHTDNARVHGPDRREIRGRHRTASSQVLV